MLDWYRVCFDPRQSRQRFANGREFEEWLGVNFTLAHRPAGYLILPWGEAPNSMGAKTWNAIVPAFNDEGDEVDVIGYLADNQWVIDDYDIVLMIKHKGENEYIYRRGEDA